MQKNRFKKKLSLLTVRPLMWLHAMMSWDFDQHRQWNRRIREIRGADRRLLGSGEGSAVAESRSSMAASERGLRRSGGLLRTAVVGGLVLATAMMTVDRFSPNIHMNRPTVSDGVTIVPSEEGMSVPYAQPPPAAVNHAIQGYYHQINQQYSDALAEYDAALRIFPNYPDVEWNKALIHSQLEEYSQALETYQQMLKINPADTDVLYNMGFALDKLDRFNEALDVYNKILEIDASDIHAPIGKGVAQYHLGDVDAAISEFVKVIDTNPKYAYYNLACMYSVKGEIEQAFQLLEKALPYMDEKLRHWAWKDPDFETIRHMPRFHDLIFGADRDS